MPDMNIASILRSEIVRLARKEVRNETQALKKAASNHRSEIAALKRRVQELERQLRRHAKTASAPRQLHDGASESQKIRFSAKGLATQRKRLGLSANDIGLLVGTSGQSIYNWERGQNRPRASQLPAIAGLRALGKKDALARLESIRYAR
jgi:DNA-binding transcriptional regulator YiaG